MRREGTCLNVTKTGRRRRAERVRWVWKEREVIKAAPFGRRRRLRLEAREREAETPALER